MLDRHELGPRIAPRLERGSVGAPGPVVARILEELRLEHGGLGRAGARGPARVLERGPRRLLERDLLGREPAVGPPEEAARDHREADGGTDAEPIALRDLGAGAALELEDSELACHLDEAAASARRQLVRRLASRRAAAGCLLLGVLEALARGDPLVALALGLVALHRGHAVALDDPQLTAALLEPAHDDVHARQCTKRKSTGAKAREPAVLEARSAQAALFHDDRARLAGLERRVRGRGLRAHRRERLPLELGEQERLVLDPVRLVDLRAEGLELAAGPRMDRSQAHARADHERLVRERRLHADARSVAVLGDPPRSLPRDQRRASLALEPRHRAPAYPRSAGRIGD